MSSCSKECKSYNKNGILCESCYVVDKEEYDNCRCEYKQNVSEWVIRQYS